jgi:centractin
MPHSIIRIDVAGRDVTKYLKLLLKKEGINLSTTAEFEIIRIIKERACYLASNPQKEETVDTEKFIFPLPDGSHVEV